MWSPQRHRTAGLDEGRPPAVVDRAIAEIERFLAHSPGLPPILTLGHLARRTGLKYYQVVPYTEHSRSTNYGYFRIRKRSGGHRLISVPSPRLKLIQKWIATHVLNKLPVHRASFAFKPSTSSIRACAEQHCGAKWLVKLDVSGFFASISEIQVYRVFREAGYVPLVSLQLSRLCTHALLRSQRYQRPEWRAWRHFDHKIYGEADLGFLPQGAPTSPMLSNLAMRKVDAALAAAATKAGLTYTRYSDDITFSTQGDFDRARARAVVRETTKTLRSVGLAVNERKTRVVPPGARKIVLGLLVDGSEPKLTREFRDRLRQHLHYLQKLGPEAHRANRKFDTVSGLYRHVLGLIDYANSVDKVYASRMRAKFDAVSWNLDFGEDETAASA